MLTTFISTLADISYFLKSMSTNNNTRGKNFTFTPIYTNSYLCYSKSYTTQVKKINFQIYLFREKQFYWDAFIQQNTYW